MDERFIVVGAGAIGTVLAEILAQQSLPIIVDRDPRCLRSWRQRGLSALSPADFRRFTFQPADVVVLTTPAGAAALAISHVPAHVPVVCMCNGLNDDLARARSRGAAMLTYGVIDFCAVRPGAADAHMVHRGGVTLPARSPLDAAGRLADVLRRGGLPTRLTDNLAGHRWSKLLLNAAFEPLCAITGLTYGGIWAHPAGPRWIHALVSEGLAVAQAAGIRLEPVHGVSPAWMRRLIECPVVGSLMAMAGAKCSANVHSVMLRAVLAHQATEVAFINGSIVRRARRLGIAAPGHRQAVAWVRALERDRLTPDPVNLKHDVPATGHSRCLVHLSLSLPLRLPARHRVRHPIRRPAARPDDRAARPSGGRLRRG